MCVNLAVCQYVQLARIDKSLIYEDRHVTIPIEPVFTPEVSFRIIVGSLM